MVIILRSNQFLLERATAQLVRRDWDTEEVMSGRAALPSTYQVASGRIGPLTDVSAGEFYMQLTDLQVLRYADNRRFAVPWFLLPSPVVIGAPAKDSTDVVFDPPGVFRIVAIDTERRPRPGERLVFYGDGITARVTTDEHGAAVFLGNPTLYEIELGQGAGIIIERI